ncbi:MAG: site-specific integrase, partial [Actinomycetota bacterium]|nr:site-specific integrase [Actinomycetota bacterium]
RPVHEDSQKTDASGRTINLDRRTAASLRVTRVTQAQERLAAGPAWSDHGLAFTWEDGRGLHPDWVSHEFARLVEKAGLPRIRLHDVRHTHATLMLKAGVHPKIVSERLGHSSVAFTLDTYSHVLPGMQAEAAEMFADLVVGDMNSS